jgi:hypothetical protein
MVLNGFSELRGSRSSAVVPPASDENWAGTTSPEGATTLGTSEEALINIRTNALALA